MNRDQAASLPRCLLVWLAASAGALLLGAWMLPDLGPAAGAVADGSVGGRPFDLVLVWVCEAAGVFGAGWLWLVTTAVVSDAVRGRHHRPRAGVPAPLRRAVLGACGVALLGGFAGPGMAAAAREDRPRSPALVAGLPLPDRATTTTHISRIAATEIARVEHVRPARVVLVRPGDTLWALAESDLPAEATDAAVTERWRSIYRANRAVIGEDPDLIHPAQQLRLPPPRELR